MSIIPRWYVKGGDVILYWNRCRMSSLTKISSGIDKPESRTITLTFPST